MKDKELKSLVDGMVVEIFTFYSTDMGIKNKWFEFKTEHGFAKIYIRKSMRINPLDVEAGVTSFLDLANITLPDALRRKGVMRSLVYKLRNLNLNLFIESIYGNLGWVDHLYESGGVIAESGSLSPATTFVHASHCVYDCYFLKK